MHVALPSVRGDVSAVELPTKRKNTIMPMSYSVRDVAEMLGLGRTTVYKLIGEGQLTRVKIGARTLIPAADVRVLMAAGQA
jgi:excisionase family DNA binding protein